MTPKANLQFKRCMQSHVAEVKECLQFRGPPHPQYGDELYKRVRNEAKEALDSIFRETQPTRQINSLQSRIQGIGGGSSSGGGRDSFQVSASANAAFGRMDHSGYSGSGGRVGTKSMGNVGTADASIAYGGINGRKMQGFGNPNFNHGPKKQTMMEKMVEAGIKKVKKYAGKEEKKPPQFMNNHTGAATYGYANNRGAGNNSLPTGSSYSGPNGDRPVVRIGSSQPQGRSRGSSFDKRRKGQVGGVWANPTGGSIASVSNNSKPAFGNSTSTFDRRDSGSSASGGKAGLASKDGQYERTLVNNMCNSGGLRAIPSTSDVNEFLTRCKSLNADVVGPLLVAKIDEEDWKVNIKALVVMEAMAKDAGCAPYADYFYENKEAIEDLLEDTEQKGVRTRCRKVLKALGVEGYEDAVVEETTRKRITITGVPKAQPKPKAEESLLDVNVDQNQDLASEFLNGSSQNNANSNEAGADTTDLLGELTIENSNTNQATAPPAPSTSGFDFLAGAASDEVATGNGNNSSGANDLLGDLLAPMAPTSNVQGGNNAQGETTGEAPPSNVDPFASLLGETSVANNAPKTTTTTGLSGGNMSSFNFMANNGMGNSSSNGASAMDRIQQAQQAARMQQMQKMQQMQQMQMMKMMQQGTNGGGQMNMRMPTMNTGMNTGVYAAGSVKTINPSLFQENTKEDKKNTGGTNAFNFVNDVLK